MKSYCPYTNIKPGNVYPNMLVVGGMNDPRVAYFEPAKWTAKLRDMRSAAIPSDSELESGAAPVNAPDEDNSDRLLLLKIQDSGHSGSSGQYSYLEDLAFEYAFLISVLGAQFRPVSSGGKGLSLSGVDYDVYWEELENENDDDEEGYEDDEEDDYSKKAPTTPMKRFADFWQRFDRSSRVTKQKAMNHSPRTGKNSSKDKKLHANSVRFSSAGNNSHTRSSSFVESIKHLSLLRNKNMKSSRTELPIDDADQLTVPSETEENEAGGSTPVSAPPSVRVERVPYGTAPTVPVSSSKSSLRHQHLYNQEEGGGRVQSTGRLYRFLGQFF